MDNIASKKAILDNSIIENMLDHQLTDFIHELPDPDVILRKAGLDYQVYNEILADAHVIGEVRSIYAGILGFKHEIVVGDDSERASQAKELCESIFAKRPDPSMSWRDLTWSIGRSMLTGRRLHHVSWIAEKGKLIPSRIFDVAPSGFAFNQEGELLIRTKQNPQGEEAAPYRWLITRHMPDRQNPYGIALLSACFWPWMFKNGGLKFFVKFCERFGIPHPVGKYPPGTPQEKVEQLVADLSRAIEDACLAVEDTNDVALLEAKSSGEIPQERLANFCNREMSKAITSQSLTTEIIDGGSHAAAKAHGDKSDKNLKADRTLVAETYNELFAWITLINFGPEVKPPKWVYKDKKELNTSDIAFIKSLAELVPISKASIYKRAEWDEPAEGDEVIFLGQSKNEEPDNEKQKPQFSQFNKPDDWTDSDQIISDIVGAIRQAIEEGETLEEAKSRILSLMPELSETELDEFMRNQFELEYGTGMVDVLNGNER